MPRTTTVDLLDLTDPFNAWCAQRRVSRSFAMRQLVAAGIGSDPQLSWLAPPDLGHIAGDWIGIDNDRKNRLFRLTLRLTQDQRNHLRIRAKEAGIPCSSYILAALTARDSDAQAIAGNDAVQTLAQSNDRLAMVALRLANWQRGGGSSDTAIINEVRATLKEHLSRAARIVAQVEVTRVGRVSQDRRTKRANRAKP